MLLHFTRLTPGGVVPLGLLQSSTLCKVAKKIEPDRVLTEVAPTDNCRKAVIDNACSNWSRKARVANGKLCQSSMPGGIYKKIKPDRVLTEVAPTGIEPVFHA